MSPIVSSTGVINGRGSGYRWVSSLTAGERETVRRGGVVLVRDDNPHWTTADYKLVTFYKGKYQHRNYYGEVEL
jgi:hypothetical protein